MNYEHGLIVCTKFKTTSIASNNSNNHLGDIYNLEIPSILSFFMLLGKNSGVKGLITIMVNNNFANF